MKCHQKIIREQEARNTQQSLFPNYWDKLDLSPAKAEIRPVSYDVAKSIILRYEWLGTMPSGFKYGFGLYIDSNLCGVACFTDTKPGSFYTFNKESAICLARGACVHWAPKWANSMLVSGCLKFLPDKYYWVMAYSDTEAGEIGTIYQACNWVCVGEIDNTYWKSPNGKRFDKAQHRHFSMRGNRSMDAYKGNSKKARQDMLEAGWTYVTGGKRYKYVYPLHKSKHQRNKAKKYLESISIPYPKRAI